MAERKTLIDLEDGGFRCPACGHVHERASKIAINDGGLLCAGCGAPVQLSEATMRNRFRSAMKLDAIDAFAGFLAHLRGAREVAVVAIAPACLVGSIGVRLEGDSIRLELGDVSGQDALLSMSDAVNLLASLARELDLAPPLNALAIKIEVAR